VLPALIEVLFQKFPGRSGDMRMALMNCEDCSRSAP